MTVIIHNHTYCGSINVERAFVELWRH